MRCYSAHLNERNCAGQTIVLVRQYIVIWRCKIVPRLLDFSFIYLIWPGVFGYQHKMICMLHQSLVCNVTPETDSCTLPKAQASLGDQDFAHYSNWRWWRRAAWLAHFSAPKLQSMTCQRLSADLPIKLSASVVSRLDPDWWRLVGKPKPVWASPPPVQPRTHLLGLTAVNKAVDSFKKMSN